jgi:hypothetical protein
MLDRSSAIGVCALSLGGKLPMLKAAIMGLQAAALMAALGILALGLIIA